jgi:hypothetical protein
MRAQVFIQFPSCRMFNDHNCGAIRSAQERVTAFQLRWAANGAAMRQARHAGRGTRGSANKNALDGQGVACGVTKFRQAAFDASAAAGFDFLTAFALRGRPTKVLQR